MFKKQLNRKPFDFTNKHDIAYLSQSLKDVENKYPIVFDFLESFCGFITPILSNEPTQICYSAGKRDVILTIKNIMRDDMTPEQIAHYYKQNL